MKQSTFRVTSVRIKWTSIAASLSVLFFRLRLNLAADLFALDLHRIIV